MRAALDTLADLLAAAVADADCIVDRVTVTAGRPAAPSGENCTAVYVFGGNVADLNQGDQNACSVRSRWAMQYEVWTCYDEDWDEVTDTKHEAAADCLYELMDLAWCALVEAKDDGTFGDCVFVEISPLEVQQRSGGMVSALGGIVVPHDCTPSSP